MCGPGCKMFLLNPGVFASRDTSSEGGPIPCHVGNPISNKRHAVFDFIIYMWSVRCKRSTIWLFTWCRHYYNTTGFSYQSVLGYSKVKAVHVYVWAGLTIILFVSKRIFKVKPYGWNLLTPVPWLTQSLFCFVFPKLLGAQICTGSQVFQAFTDTLGGAQSRRLHHLYLEIISAVIWCIVLWYMICIYKFRFVFQSYVI